MYYFHVWVRSDRYRGMEPLTYASAVDLPIGSVVRVPLRDESVLGFVTTTVAKPRFATKPINEMVLPDALPPQSVKLAKWLVEFYASPVGVISTLFLPTKLTLHRTVRPAEQENNTIGEQPKLTPEQAHALRIIQQPDTYTLHGRTGSGKTRIYLELVKRQLESGKSSVILCPEIGLTSQLAAQFRDTFGSRVITLHSQLTAREREIQWLHIAQAEQPVIVIGPRSALFSPVHDPGLIIVDESHDHAYKQEQPPYYHAVRVASQLRELHQAILVLGSATPSINDYYVASSRAKPIIRLSQLAKSTPAERTIDIIDLKDRSQFSRSSYISDILIKSVAESLSRGEQALLYLNRRGTARVTLCNECGWQALCPHCDLPLTYHGDTFSLRCHICGYNQRPLTTCPTCGNPSVTFRSFGTKAIVTEVERLFPDARILRFDTDNTKEERLDEQYKNIIDGQADILVGTQMLTKGLDLPQLSTLGVLLADTSLYLPDYTARERTYQLLTQVIGRIGRGHLDSRAVVQTYYPESELLQAALADDWQRFYDAEIDERRQYAFPPFYHLLKISCKRTTTLSAERVMNTFKTHIEQAELGLIIDGPAPAFHEKVAGKYQWQLVIKTRSRGTLLKALKLMPKDATYDLDPVDLL